MTIALPAPFYMPVPNQKPGQLDATYTINFGLDPNQTLSTTGSFNGYDVKPIRLHVYNNNNQPVVITIGGMTLYAPQNSDSYFDISGITNILFSCQTAQQITIDLLNFAVPVGSTNITNLSQSNDPFFNDVIGLYHFQGTNTTNAFIDNSSNGYGLVSGNLNTEALITTSKYLYGQSCLGIYPIDGNPNGCLSQNKLTPSTTITVEFALFVPSVTNNDNIVIVQHPTTVSAANCAFKVSLYGDGTPNVAVVQCQYSGNGSARFYIPLNQWVYIAFCIIGNTCVGYLNGQFITQSATGTISYTDDYLTIGGPNTSGSDVATKYVAELRITDAIRYTSNSYNVQTAPFPNYA
jgi:hypothetical protein